MIEFGRENCGNFKQASSREWLVTNGIGGFASGTIAGVLTRRYHGLLIAATEPPLGRRLLVPKLEETMDYLESEWRLGCNQYTTGRIDPQGYKYLERFRLDGSIPIWTYAIADAIFEKKVWMEYGENTTYITYTNLRSSKHLDLRVNVFVTDRDYHGLSRSSDFQNFMINNQPDRIIVSCSPAAPGFRIFCDRGEFIAHPMQHTNCYLSAEARRGESAVEDHYSIGSFSAQVFPGDRLTIILSAEKEKTFEYNSASSNRKIREAKLVANATQLIQSNPDKKWFIEQLVLAADQFIVTRTTGHKPQGMTILAGYPWFSDWGRDTMISLPGLTLVTGRHETAREIISTYAEYIDHGMLPNRFPDEGERPEYNTIDATLWYFEAIRQYLDETHDLSLLEEIYPALQGIIDWHIKGTRDQIHCDPQDGLLYGGQGNSQLTWMDVRIDGLAVTPRIGKPVEINALWINALASMVGFSTILGLDPTIYQIAVNKANLGFARFWNYARGYCFDVIDSPDGDDATLRPNQLIAASLAHSPLSMEQVRSILDVCSQQLLTFFGLRSLSPNDPNYVGRYNGDRLQRDSAYHQGTVWAWLIGPFISAHLRAYRDPHAAMVYLESFANHLTQAGVGSISEIFDGDPPFEPQGCIAQAWSVAEILRVLRDITRCKYAETKPTS